MRRTVLILCLLTVACLLLASPLAAAQDNHRLWLIAPAELRVVPGADRWRIHVSAVGIQPGEDPRIVSVAVNGRAVDAALLGPSTMPLVVARGVRASELDRWTMLRRNHDRAALTVSEASEFDNLTRKLAASADRDVAPLELVLDPRFLPVEVRDLSQCRVTVAVRWQGQDHEFTTDVSIMSLPSDSSWSPADLHIHTTYSDGKKTPAQVASICKGMGYRVVYVTDHAGDIISKHGWQTYSTAINNASDADIKLYPGAEIATTSDSHGLAYGIVSMTGLADKTHNHQTLIDNIISNNSGVSSAAIAHPTHLVYPWTSWTVTKYRGIELMSGVQTSFGDGASPMVRWRSELSRLLSSTFSYGYFASARTGSDWHATTFDPNHFGYVTWLRTSNWSSKSSVDSAIYYGRTVASRKGSLGYMTINNGTTTRYVGDRWTGIAQNTTLRLSVVFKPAVSGTYTLQVYRNNKAQLVWSHSGPYTAGNSYNPTTNYQFTFPGGSNYYYLYISGPDYVYSSPIFIKN